MDICGIPVMPVLLQIASQRLKWEKNKSGMYWGTWFEGFENSVNNSMPEGASSLRVRAFMKLLDKKLGLVSGCHCGCRGDYELTADGYRLISAGDYK